MYLRAYGGSEGPGKPAHLQSDQGFAVRKQDHFAHVQDDVNLHSLRVLRGIFSLELA